MAGTFGSLVRATSLVCLALLCLGGPGELLAQVDLTPAAEAPAASQPPAAGTPVPNPAVPQATPGPGDPNKPAQPGSDGTKPPGKKEKEPEKPAPIRRPDKPSEPADQTELKVRPDKNNQVQFNFRGQAWPDVLQWLADISGESLDWQELPSDYLNLSVSRPYSIDETYDLINRHLLARGFTLLRQDGFVTVANTKTLNTALVPRVTPEELASRRPHEFVKVSFRLTWLLAEDAAKELQSMVSTNGKLVPLKDTNRLEAIDAVANLRDLYRLIDEEQRPEKEHQRLVREFELEFARAAEVKRQLEDFLGIKSQAASTAPMSPEQMAMQQQQAMMMAQMRQQQMQQNPNAAAAAGSDGNGDVSLMVNSRKNSIVVHAPPDKMAIVEDAIELLDVPGAHAESLDAFLGRMQIYRLASLDPRQVVETLEQLGSLSPTTQLYVDEKNRAVIAHASLADHFAIRSLIEKLDGTGRKLKMIQLRRLEADQVAGTIEALMVGVREPQNQRRTYYDYYDPFGYGGRRGQDDDNKDRFRADADIEHNRLLLWANEVELAEVYEFLAELGEIPARGGSGRMVRVLDDVGGAAPDQVLERIRFQWKQLGLPNRLILPQAEDEPEGEPGAEPLPARQPLRDPAPPPGDRDPSARLSPPAPAISDAPPALQRGPALPVRQLVQVTRFSPLEVGADDPLDSSERSPQDAPRDARPPIRIQVDELGRVIVTSPDTQALDLLEELLAATSVSRKDFHVFKLEYAPAFWVKVNLEDFFEEDDKNDARDEMRAMWFGYRTESRRDESSRLSKKRPVKFISDLDTNTILVQHADPSQLATIAELIKLYDVPEPVSSQSKRVTRLFPVRHSKADVIADTVKDAFRDLLSDNDKALMQQQMQQQQQQRVSDRSTYINYDFGGEEDSEPRTKVTFKGKLSIGVDVLSNTLMVSTEGENLMTVVGDMIEQLDRAAQPVDTVRVVNAGQVDVQHLREALDKLLGQQVQQSERPANGQPPQPRPGQPPQQPATAQPIATPVEIAN